MRIDRPVVHSKKVWPSFARPVRVLSKLPSPRKAKFEAAKLPYEFSEAALVSWQLLW